jgi:hypothetical protein
VAWPLALLAERQRAAAACWALAGDGWELALGVARREAECGCWALAGGGWDSGSLGTAELGRIRFSRTVVGLGWAGSLGRAAAGHLGLGQNNDCWTGRHWVGVTVQESRVPVGHPWVK